MVAVDVAAQSGSTAASRKQAAKAAARPRNLVIDCKTLPQRNFERKRLYGIA
jgi:hypothetical protein